MAIYKFRISFEDYDVIREIDIRSNQSFEDLHNVIHQSIGYKPDVPSSFYISNDFWHKGQEITIFPNQNRIDKKVSLMCDSKLHNFIEDPHQKFYYTSNFERPFDFHIELIRILLEADPKLSYPAILKTSGEPPRQFSLAPIIPSKSTDAIPPEEFEEELEEETESEHDDFALAVTEGLDEDDTSALSEKISGEEETEQEDEFGFGPDDPDEGPDGAADEDLHHGKEDY